jgi:tetratricopeptide (TPR) repeat protein
MIILYGLIVAEVATSSDPCAEYKKLFGAKEKRLNEIIKYGPVHLSSAGSYVSNDQDSVIKEFIQFIFETKNYECGIAKVTEVLDTFDEPEYNFFIYRVRALFYEELCKYKEAKRDYEAMMDNSEYSLPYTIDPSDGTTKQEGYSDYAFFLATVPVESLRDGKKANYLANEALDIKKNHRSYQVIAAVCAELNKFKQAIEFQNLAIQNFNTESDTILPPNVGKDSFAIYKLQLETYKKKMPWRLDCKK